MTTEREYLERGARMHRESKAGSRALKGIAALLFLIIAVGIESAHRLGPTETATTITGSGGQGEAADVRARFARGRERGE